MSALAYRLELIAADVGRLRRRADPETSTAHALDRIAGNVDLVDAILTPTAADFYRANVAAGDDPESAVTRALATSDRRARQLRSLLAEVER
jgi:hypothetical protein